MRSLTIAALASMACTSDPEPSGERVRELPASAAGSPSASGPGVPMDFRGTVTRSLPLTREEAEALARAKQRRSRR